jgi:DNA-binding PadR family transcriptional regulator
MKRQYNQLPQVAFSILLALSLRERHGYEIMKQVKEDSNGKISMGPGSLYTSLGLLNERGMVAEVVHPDDLRRRYYRLSDKGKRVLKEELDYYANSLALARQRQVYGTEGEDRES